MLHHLARPSPFVLLAALVATGCQVELTGAVYGRDGAPARTSVALMREGSSLPVDQLYTNSNGRYRLTVDPWEGDDRAWLRIGDEYDSDGYIAYEPGAVDEAAELTVPDFHIWGPQPEQSPDDTSVRVAPVVVSATFEVEYRAVMHRGGARVLLAASATPNLVFDPRILEDGRDYEITSHAYPVDPDATRVDAIGWRPVPLTSAGVRVPVSRDAPCAIWKDSDGWVWSITNCPLTDGSMYGYDNRALTNFVLDLGETLTVAAVSLVNVVPNVPACRTSIVLSETLEDWQPGGELTVRGRDEVLTGSAVYDLPTPLPARYVHFAFLDGCTASVGQASVWSP